MQMKLILGLWIALFTIGIHAETNYKDHVGYVEFGSLEGVYGDPKVEINLGGAILALVGSVSRHENPELAEIIRKLVLVRVLVYELDDDAEDALNLIDKTTASLKKKNWLPIVSVNEDDQKVRIYMHSNDEVVDGMVVMVVESPSLLNHNREAVFINIIGEIRPEELHHLTESLDIDVDVDAGV